MEKLILANWKANLSPVSAHKWLDVFLARYEPLDQTQVVLALPVIYLRELSERIVDSPGVFIAAQSISSYPPGSYTGSTPALWLENSADYVIAGHREHRLYLHMSSQDVANQVSEALSSDLQPIVCLDKEFAPSQISAIQSDELDKVIFAYTPAEADQLEIARKNEVIVEAVEYLSSLSNGRPVLYGGGVNAENARHLLELPKVSGLMVGRSCLDPDNFLQLLQNVR